MLYWRERKHTTSIFYRLRRLYSHSNAENNYYIMKDENKYELRLSLIYVGSFWFASKIKIDRV